MGVCAPPEHLATETYTGRALMKRIVIAASIGLFVQGCALGTGFTRGVIEAASNPQPSLADPLHASGGSSPPPRIFGPARIGGVPTNLPLPKSANPSEYFRVKSLSAEARQNVFATVDVTVEVLCTFFSGMSSSSDPGCHRKRVETFGIVSRPPMINR